MNIQEKMDLKWNEITATKKEREELFSDFENNKGKISELYYETEIKQLEYMFLKREQLEQLRKTTYHNENVDRVERILETCITQVRERLIKKGLKERLQAEKLI
ncbi:hypothetical protein E3U55_14455 [Filobacillus milosensis]|uniref:DUF2508 family protein n=1 Tax=Filobacillus milosensis TaxID=94137 RepID=A0A4Y8IG91_9BACI|nr:hypothetical protein [Filobacillus milosensis]TFB14114.1 hypothetical protein E3U55_14455 [Filobacillus milosensis]